MLDNVYSDYLVLIVSEFEMPYKIHLVIHCYSTGDQNRGYGELKHNQYAADEPAPASRGYLTGQDDHWPER